MHRSGTSAITRGLQELGVELGKSLMPAHRAVNAKGFWEDMDVYNLSERLLERLGLRWDSVAPIDASTWERPEITLFRLEAIDLVNAKTAGTPIWGFKDPRTIRLLPFWKSVFEALEIAPCYVIAVRNPLSIARSLEARDRIPPEKSSLLWLQHTIPVVSETADSPRLVVDYDRLMDDPVRELQRMAASLGLEAPKPEKLASSKYVREFLSPELRHTRYNPTTLKVCPALAGLAKEAYELLFQAAQDRLSLDDLQRMDPWLQTERTIHEFGAFSGYLEQRENQLQQTVTENAAQAEALSQREEDIRQKTERLAEMEQTAAALEDELRERNARVTELQGAVAQRDCQIGTLDHTLSDHFNHIATLNHSANKRDSEIAALNQALADRESQIANLHQALADRDGLIANLNQALADRDSQIAGLNQVVAGRDAYLAALHASTSWRLTAPLRFLKRRVPTVKDILKTTLRRSRALLSGWVRALYVAAPLSTPVKLKLKSLVLATLSPLLRDTEAYRAWMSFERRRAELAASAANHTDSPRDHLEGGRTAANLLLLTYVTERHGAEAAHALAGLMDAYGLDQPDVRAPTAALVQTWTDRLNRLLTLRSQVADPEVSVIIPIYNQSRHTLACLESILTWSTKASFEIIIADDCSTDPLLQHALASLKGIKVVRTASNLGFLRNCNRAAARAGGKCLLFLNNDTLVLPGCVDKLLATFRDHPNTGIAGSKKLYPDGSLQEAGCIIWNDGSAITVGQGQDPRLPQFNYLHETDYSGGSSLMVRSELFRQLGGFDEHYTPAYAEDSDLAFRSRKLGWEVLYRPDSEVIHFLSVSSDMDANGGAIRYLAINNAKFAERWHDVLTREHFNPGEHTFLARDRSSERPHLLIIDQSIPQFDRDAGSRTIYQYTKLFVNKGFQVTFWPDDLRYDRLYAHCLQDMGVEVLYGDSLSGGFEEWINETGQYFDYVLLSRPHIASRFARVLHGRSPAKLIYYGHDLHHDRLQQQLALRPNANVKQFLKETRAMELAAWHAVDVVWYPSEEECKVATGHLPKRAVRAVPAFYFENEPHPTSPQHRTGLLFVGSFGHAPNVDGLGWFVTEVWPRISSTLPGITLNIVGANPPTAVTSLASEHIRLLGHVSDEDLADLYAKSRVALAPLRIGAGVKGKVVESLWHGLPVVTTSTGTQGLPGAEKFLVNCDSPESFAERIVALCTDNAEWKATALAGQAYVQEHFSLSAVTAALAKDIPELGGSSSTRSTRRLQESLVCPEPLAAAGLERGLDSPKLLSIVPNMQTRA